jgi:hypothetical protein
MTASTVAAINMGGRSPWRPTSARQWAPADVLPFGESEGIAQTVDGSLWLLNLPDGLLR